MAVAVQTQREILSVLKAYKPQLQQEFPLQLRRFLVHGRVATKPRVVILISSLKWHRVLACVL